jgi:hypothetical protein
MFQVRLRGRKTLRGEKKQRGYDPQTSRHGLIRGAEIIFVMQRILGLDSKSRILRTIPTNS